MSDNTNDTTPTEPLPPVAPPVAEPVAAPAGPAPAEPVNAAPPTAGPAYATPAPSGSGNRSAMIAAAAGLALLFAIGIFAVGVAVGSHLGAARGVRQYALSGQQGPGGQQFGPGMMRGQGRGFDGDGDSGRGFGGHRGGQGYGAPQGFGGQGSISPTASVPAVPGQ